MTGQAELGPAHQGSTFREVFDTQFSYVCRVLRRLGVGSADLEDLAQEVFVSVYRRFTEYDQDRPIRPWLFAFALRTAANHQRLARHRREVSDSETKEPIHTTTPEQVVSDQQAQELVLAGLQRIPFERRSVLVMHDIDGFRAPEIAEVLSIPVNTVYSRVRIARDEDRGAIKREKLRREHPQRGGQ